MHAAVAERDGGAVLLTGDQEAGKSTLVAGLVERGSGYLTDEAAAVRRDSNLVEPYAKPLSIDPGSWGLLSNLRPANLTGSDEEWDHQWQVPADSIRPGAFAGAAPLRLVVDVQYRAGAPTTFRRLSRARMLVLLMSRCFATQGRLPEALTSLADAIRSVGCYALESGDLGEMCDAVELAVGKGDA